MTDMPPTLPPAEWYSDPHNPQQQRWWTGATWSEHIRPHPMPSPPPPVPPWQLNQSSATTQPQANFGEFGVLPERATRRGFFDSPFERAGTPRNTPGTLSLIFVLLAFLAVGMLRGAGILLGIPLALTAIILGIVGIVRAGRIGGKRATAITGLCVATLFVLGSVVLVAAAVSMY